MTLLWERKKQSLDNFLLICLYSVKFANFFPLLLLLPFYSFRTNYLARDIFIDKQSFLRVGMDPSIGRVLGWVGGCVVRSYIHESRMRSSERKPIIRVRTNLIYNYGYESLRRSRVRRWKIIIIKAAISCVRTIVYTCLLKVSLTIRDPLAQ